VTARVVGFEKNMAGRLAEAHVVVGKAGGLTVSEAMTAGRPMVMVGTVPGNELSNERLVVDARAGQAARADQVGPLVDALRAAGVLAAMGARARELVLPGAADRVLDVTAELAVRVRRHVA
jgi:UDP-N-acetylglucosamine:LPS N-acetylglucosamine transferase